MADTTSSVLPAAPAPRITDSPWFWVYIFSTAAVLALFVMEGKYNHRQNHIEDEYLYGTRTLAKPADADAKMAQAARADSQKFDSQRSDSYQAKSQPADAERAPLAAGPQPLTHPLLISLVPLRVVAIAAMMVSCVGLQWSMFRGRRARAGVKSVAVESVAAASVSAASVAESG